jgi:hypothetical protein
MLNSFSCTDYRSDYLFFRLEQKKVTNLEVYRIFFYRFLGFCWLYYFFTLLVVEQNFSQLQWCYLFPIFVAFALKSEESIIWGILFFIGITFIVAASDFDFISPETGFDQKIRFLFSFFMVSVILIVIAIVHNRNLLELYERQQALKKSEERYKSAFEHNKILLKEVHHRVKNNLQVISSLLYLQTGKIYDPHSKNLIRETRHRIRSMAIVYEKLYESKDFNQIDMESYLKSLSAYLLTENKKITRQSRWKLMPKIYFWGLI